MLRDAGFAEGIWGEQIRLEGSFGSTTPDVIYRSAEHGPDEGIAIYLDGLSEHLHGNPKTREKDQHIRSWLRSHGWEVIELAATDLADLGAMRRFFIKLAGYLGNAELKSNLKSSDGWFTASATTPEAGARPPLRRVNPAHEDRYRNCVPLVPLKAAAGGFGDPQFIENGEQEWVEIEARRALRPGMFVAQVVGKSMEPLIPDGAHCLFSAPVTGSRQGRVLLVSLRDEVDPESGERFTIKRYESSKSSADGDTWRHISITLKPENTDFAPIVLRVDSEGLVHVIAEFLQVLQQPGSSGQQESR